MCAICGCSEGNTVTMIDVESGVRQLTHEHTHPDGTTHSHDHHHDGDDHMVSLQVAVLAKNDRVAARNRGWFEGRGVLALNLLSSPGAGKTTLLERTIRDLSGSLDLAVIEGDQMTANDAARIRDAGARAVQINTGSGCHLEAEMIATAVVELGLQSGSVLFIENVGNLVCPALFDLGERMKIAMTSITEGEDKPEKYPFMFRAVDMVILNKIDLAPHVEFDRSAWRRSLDSVNPTARVIELSARTGEGLSEWRDFLIAAQARVV